MHLLLAMRSFHGMHLMHSASILPAILGGILLLFGRRLFWLFVGALGFVAGVEGGRQFLHGMPHATILIGAIVLGLIGIGLAIFLQKFAIGLAGFVAGSYLALSVLNATAGRTYQFAWVIILVAGLIGLVLMLGIFEWALIGLSSLLGADLLVHSVHLLARYSWIALAALTILGVLVQAGFRIRRGGR